MKRGPYKTKPGTIAALVAGFRLSPQYRRWAPGTARKADKHYDDFVANNGGQPANRIRRGDIVRMLSEFGDVPGSAGDWLKAMRALFGYALDIEEVPADPTAGVKFLKGRHEEGFRSWTEDEIATFQARHPFGTLAHTMFTLLLFTGAARVDVVRLGWQNIRDGRIEYRRQKTMSSGGVLVSVMILPELQRVLDSLPRDQLTFLHTQLGGSRGPGSVSRQITRWAEMAGLGGKDVFGRRLGPHGLRKALARRLVEAGALPTDVAAVLGQRDVKSAMIYFRDYDRGRAADTAMERLGNISPSKGNVFRLKKP